jgi:lipid-binding SYLF domain-containing protein
MGTPKIKGCNMKTTRIVELIVTLALAGALPAAAAEVEHLDSDVRNAVQKFQASSPRMRRLFNKAYGYAVFPAIDKAAAGIGGAEGTGQVYENGVLLGTANLAQATVGAQLGGQLYSELIFFESQKALDEFKDGKTAISAALSAAVAMDGAGAEVKYQHGVIVFTMDRAGLMFEASIGGQRFKFNPLAVGRMAPASAQPAPAETPAPPPALTPPAAPPELPAQTPPQ